MRVLALTWEFPPIITGGLGMACYGMVKAFLKRGTEVDLVMPSSEDVYFSLREPADADNLRPIFSNPPLKENPASAGDFRKLLGSGFSVYYKTRHRSNPKYSFEDMVKSASFSGILETLKDEYFLFRQVGDYTAMAVKIGSKLRFDVIHAHDWLTYPAGMILKQLSGRPLVTHIHATEFDRAGGTGDRRIHHIEYAGMTCADRVIAVSDYTANIISQKYHVNPDKIRTVHNAYNRPNPANNHRRIFREPTVLFMGRITLQKGPDYFLEVARRVIQRHKDVRFIMAGSGDMEKHLLHRAASFELGTKFLVAGFLNRDEVERILSTTDIFVLPSVSEPFGIAPLEAISHGAVAIISKNSGVAEIIQNAYKVDFWDIDQMVSTIINLIENPEEFLEMSNRGRAEVANIEWDDAVGKIMDVFYELEPIEKC